MKGGGRTVNDMAKPEHLAILKQGREVWNQWRVDAPDIRPDLSGVNFNQVEEFKDSAIWGKRLMDGADDVKRLLLSEFNLSEVDFYKADLSFAELSRADLSDAKLVHANLSSANLRRADLNGAQLWGANFQQADLKEARFGPVSYTHLTLPTK